MSLYRPTCAVIDLAALHHNYLQIRARAGCAVLAVVKADAYGHGAVAVARALGTFGIDLLGVALLEEAQELRDAGITTPILLLGETFAGQEAALASGAIIPCLSDLASIRRLDEEGRRLGRVLPFHLKIDTGMSRLGLLPTDLARLLAGLAPLTQVRLDGVLSHFALADEPDSPVSAQQEDIFRQALAALRAAGYAPTYIHFSNSAALFSRAMPECNLVRPGITLYGGLPGATFAPQLELQPVMNVRSQIARLKTIPAGTGVSYGHHFVAPRETVLAAIPIGYADGYNRRLTNGEALLRGERVTVVGTICMDWILLDVTAVVDVAVGEQVTLLGRDGDAIISADEWAARIGTISYEVFCAISKRVPRVVVDEVPG